MNRQPDIPARATTAELTAVVLLLFVQVAIALIRIDAPFTEPAAYGRSCVNATIARNFFEHGMRLLYPQLDWGPPPGYTTLEFPLIPYLAAAVYWITGIQEWVGRGIPAVFGLGTTLVVWGIVRELTEQPAARVAAVTLMVLSPTFEFFSRVFQSDTAMVFFVTLSLYLLMRDRRRESSVTFAAACIASVLAMLLKPSSLVLLPCLASIPLLFARRPIRRALILIAVTLIPVAAYYAFARVMNTYPQTVGIDAVTRRATLARMLQISYDVQIAKDVVQAVTPAGVIALIAGVLIAPFRRETWFVLLWAAGAAGLNAIFNEALSHHEYYQLIWVPLAAISAALAVSTLATSSISRSARLVAAAVVVLLLVGSSVLTWRFLALRLQFPQSSAERLTAALLVEQHTPPDALVGVEEIDLLYYSHRRGWMYGNDTGKPIAVKQLSDLPGRGVRYVMVVDADGRLSTEGRAFLDGHGHVAARGSRTVLWELDRD